MTGYTGAPINTITSMPTLAIPSIVTITTDSNGLYCPTPMVTPRPQGINQTCSTNADCPILSSGANTTCSIQRCLVSIGQPCDPCDQAQCFNLLGIWCEPLTRTCQQSASLQVYGVPCQNDYQCSNRPYILGCQYSPLGNCTKLPNVCRSGRCISAPPDL